MTPHPQPLSRRERGDEFHSSFHLLEALSHRERVPPREWRGVRLAFALCILMLGLSNSWADKVITKDGKTYTGKILIDTDKAVLIGNPPFDPNSTLIQGEDIKTIIYEEYRPNSPSERRRGVTMDFHVTGNASTSDELSVHPTAGLSLEGGFRFHPLFEIGAGASWLPEVTANGGGVSVTGDPGNGPVTRGYTSFWQYTLAVTGKIYPFYKKMKWKTEPYILTGYGWSHLIPKASGDSFQGGGWLLGGGAIYPLSTHVFLDGRFTYFHLAYDTVNFLGQEGSISPEIAQHQYSLAVGISYRI
jgi:hypothetical protein